MIDYSKFLQSTKNLALQYENYRTLDEYQPDLIREGITESVIHRFEICYDCLWKVLKRYLVENLGIPEVPNSPNPVFVLAFENNLLTSPLDQWMSYSSARTDTSHDYSHEKALAALELAKDFIEDAIDLYQTLSGEPWE